MRRSEVRLRERHVPHGIPGQLNLVVPDAESYRTGYGAHNRIVWGASGGEFLAREDRRGLPDSTEAQRLAVLREEWPGVRVRLKATEASDDGRCIYFTYESVR